MAVTSGDPRFRRRSRRGAAHDGGPAAPARPWRRDHPVRTVDHGGGVHRRPRAGAGHGGHRDRGVDAPVRSDRFPRSRAAHRLADRRRGRERHDRRHESRAVRGRAQLRDRAQRRGASPRVGGEVPPARRLGAGGVLDARCGDRRDALRIAGLRDDDAPARHRALPVGERVGRAAASGGPRARPACRAHQADRWHVRRALPDRPPRWRDPLDPREGVPGARRRRPRDPHRRHRRGHHRATSRSRTSCIRRRSSSRSGCSPAASRTTSTTSCA